MSLRSRARRLQRSTGITYQQALEQVRREARARGPATGAGPTEKWRAIAHELLAARAGSVPIEVVDVAVDPLDAACTRLLEASAARAVVLLNRARWVIASAGAATGAWPLLALRARAVPSGPIEVGDGRSLLSRRLSGGELLIVLFDRSTSYGLVLLRLAQAADEIERLLAARARLGIALPPPGGGQGSGGAPVTAWESVEIFALDDPDAKKRG
jgi:hypothetical protein